MGACSGSEHPPVVRQWRSEVITCNLDSQIQIQLLLMGACSGSEQHPPVSQPEADPSLVGLLELRPNFKADYSFITPLASRDSDRAPLYLSLEDPLFPCRSASLPKDRVHGDSLVRLWRSEVLTCILDSQIQIQLLTMGVCSGLEHVPPDVVWIILGLKEVVSLVVTKGWGYEWRSPPPLYWSNFSTTIFVAFFPPIN